MFNILIISFGLLYCNSFESQGEEKILSSVNITETAKFVGHRAEITSLDLLKDNSTLLSSSFDGTVRVWNLKNRTQVSEVSPPSLGEYLQSAFFLREGTHFFSTTHENCCILDTSTKKEIFQKDLPNTSIGYSSDRKFLFSGQEDGSINQIEIIGMKTKRSWSAHNAAITAICVSSNNSLIVSGDMLGEVRVWKSETGTLLSLLKGHLGKINCLSITRDTTKVLSVSDDCHAKVWDLHNSKILVDFQKHKTRINCGAISPDGKVILTGDSQSGLAGHIPPQLLLWDANRGDVISSFVGHKSTIFSVLFLDNGREALSASGDPFQRDNSIRLWNLPSHN